MKKKTNLIKIAIAIVLVLGFTFMQHSQSAVADIPAQETEPANKIVIDVTYDPGTQTYSLGGFSSAELSQLGAPAFTPELWEVLANLDKINLRMQGEEINLILNEQQLATMEWDATSREILAGMVNAFIDIGKVDMERTEAWLGNSDVEFSLRNTKELSDPLLIELATILQVKVHEGGEVRVEGIPTGYAITPDVLATLEAANIHGIKLCWNKGVLNTELQLDEMQALPQFTIYEEGVGVADKAFGLNLGDLGPLFNSAFGAGLVIGDADPITGECLP